MKYFLPLVWGVLAQVGLQAAAPPVKGAPALPKRHALILCGHPGDAEHVKSFTETVRKLGDGLTKTIGIPPERQHILFGAERPKDLPGATGPATREAVAAKVAEVREKLTPLRQQRSQIVSFGATG